MREWLFSHVLRYRNGLTHRWQEGDGMCTSNLPCYTSPLSPWETGMALAQPLAIILGLLRALSFPIDHY